MVFNFKKFRFLILFFLIIAFICSASYYAVYNVLFPKKYSHFVEKYAYEYCLDSNFVYAVIKAESNFDEKAASSKGARGLMQITESTGAWAAEKIGISDFESYMLYDPETNIHIGCWYLDNLLKQYGNVDAAVAAYNAGSGNVDKWIEQNKDGSKELDREIIPFAETKNYVEKVDQYLKIYDFLYN